MAEKLSFGCGGDAQQLVTPTLATHKEAQVQRPIVPPNGVGKMLSFEWQPTYRWLYTTQLV